MMMGRRGGDVEILRARRLATGLMRRHGLDGWQLVFDNAKTRAGICRAEPREIGLSRVLTQLHSEAEVRETILHEIAHALVGPAHGHDAVWRARARQIGCAADRCVPDSAPRVPGPWVATCPAGHRTTRHRQPTRVQSCGQCSRTFDPDLVLDWTYEGRRVPMHPRYEAERRRIATTLPSAGAAARSGRSGAAPGRPAGRADGPALLAVGSRVRLTGPGKYAGVVGRIVRVGRTRYHVQTASLLLTTPFASAERC
jgi:predicted SprT family Zn-dependent metalloprotease